MHTQFLSENLKGNNQLEDIDIDESVILQRFLEKWIERVWVQYMEQWRTLFNTVMNFWSP